MKPDWDSLAETYAGSTSVLIGDVDCTTDEGKEACSRFEVRGYPTIKYFTAETGKGGSDYQGGRDLESLKKFVEDKLAKQCLLEDTADCDEKELGYIEKMKAKGADAAKTELTRLEGMKAGAMKPETKVWLMKRIAILKQM